MSGGTKPLFREIDADDADMEPTEIETMCMYCHENGVTRILMIKIPFFKEVIISSFSCDHCGFEDKEIQPGGRIQDKGVNITLTIKTPKDLNREVVKSDSCTFKIPHLDFEIPPAKGNLTTIEGIFDLSADELKQEQPVRRITQPEVAQKIDEFIDKLEQLKLVKDKFDIIIDDPSGNSFIENPYAPAPDPAIQGKHYVRSAEQDSILGIQTEAEADPSNNSETPTATEPSSETPTATEPNSETPTAEPNSETPTDTQPTDKLEEFKTKEEVLTFHVNCPQCNSPCESNMKVIDIPFFKEVVLMSTVCEACGHRDNEVKGGAGISDKGTKVTLKITDPSDLTRDILKSDTSAIGIPEWDFSMEEGTLGGKFTTIEGLLLNMKDQLMEVNPFFAGDSAGGNKLKILCDQLTKLAAGEIMNVHFVLDDPAGNSYLQNVYAPEDDPELKVEHYTRTFEQNETLGLNDMKTENYS